MRRGLSGVERKAVPAPGVEAAGERTDAPDAAAPEEQRHPGAGGLVRSGAVEDELAVARDLGIRNSGSRSLTWLRAISSVTARASDPRSPRNVANPTATSSSPQDAPPPPAALPVTRQPHQPGHGLGRGGLPRVVRAQAIHQTLGAWSLSAHGATSVRGSTSRRSRSFARRSQLDTVPSGRPVSSAISRTDQPSTAAR